MKYISSVTKSHLNDCINKLHLLSSLNNITRTWSHFSIFSYWELWMMLHKPCCGWNDYVPGLFICHLTADVTSKPAYEVIKADVWCLTSVGSHHHTLADLTDLCGFFYHFLSAGFSFSASCCTLWTLSSCSTEAMCRLPVTSLFICFWLVERSHGDGSLQDSMGELHSRFAVSLYQTLTETENNSNLIVSPVSVSLSLGLLQLGARGNTLAQLEGTLGYNVNGTSHLTRRWIQVAAPPAVRALSAVGTRWCGAVLLLLLLPLLRLALQSTVVSGAIIPASTPALISLTSPAARPQPRGREVTVFITNKMRAAAAVWVSSRMWSHTSVRDRD